MNQFETPAGPPEPYRIPAANLEHFSERMSVLARRAEKLGVGSITWEQVGVEQILAIEYRVRPEQEDAFVDQVSELNVERIHELTVTLGGHVIATSAVHYVVVGGDRPKLNGWELLAVLEHAGEAGTILRTVPGIETAIPSRFRELGEPACEHCNVRRMRRDTFVVGHEDGRFAQVGRQCLRDFTGHQSPEAIARFAQYLFDAAGIGSDSERQSGSGQGTGAPLREFCIETASVIRQSGWMSRTKAREFERTATADKVCPAFSSDAKDRKLYREEFGSPTDRDVVDAEAAIAWASQLRDSGDELNDYLWNVSVVVLSGQAVDYRRAGIAASIVAVHLRNAEREIIKRSERAAAVESKHFGTVGVREVFTLTLQFSKYIASDFGGSTLHRLVDANGNVAVWFASGDSPWEVTVRDEFGHMQGSFIADGEIRTVKATVKRHDTRDGVAQTILTRVAMVVAKPVKGAA